MTITTPTKFEWSKEVFKTMKSYQGAVETLGGKPKVKLENNTWLVRIDEDTCGVMLHNTYVVKYVANGDIMMNANGFRSSTTKKRMNKYSPFSIFTEKHNWYVETPLGTFAYNDGVEFNSAGEPKDGRAFLRAPRSREPE